MHLKNPISRSNFALKATANNGIKPLLSEKKEGILAIEKNKQFLSLISHNIKNPFGALLGYSDLILEDYEDLCEAEKILYLSELKKTANHTYKYLERFFEWIYYKTDNINTNFQKINLRELIVISTKNLLLENDYLGEINLQIDAGLEIFADNESISKAFYYIIENCMNYSTSNGKISINAGIMDNFVNIQIKDDGSGIPEEIMKKLFDISHNFGSDQNSIYNGTGLGLILVKEILKINNGTIRIESKVNIGTSVFIKLPINCNIN